MKVRSLDQLPERYRRQAERQIASRGTSEHPVHLTLPWPPSVNHLYERRKRGRGGDVTLTERAERFYDQVARIVSATRATDPVHFPGRLALAITLCPPDNVPKCDLDNYCKAVGDALKRCHVFADDEQIDELTVRRGAPTSGGAAHVTIGALGGKGRA